MILTRTPTAEAARQFFNRVASWESRFDAFHSLMIQLPETHHIRALLLTRRYGPSAIHHTTADKDSL